MNFNKQIMNMLIVYEQIFEYVNEQIKILPHEHFYKLLGLYILTI